MTFFTTTDGHTHRWSERLGERHALYMPGTNQDKVHKNAGLLESEEQIFWAKLIDCKVFRNFYCCWVTILRSQLNTCVSQTLSQNFIEPPSQASDRHDLYN